MSQKLMTKIASTVGAIAVGMSNLAPSAIAAPHNTNPDNMDKQASKASANCMVIGAAPKNDIQKSLAKMFTRLNKSPFFSSTIYPKIKGSVTVCDNPRALAGAYAGYACSNNTIYVDGSGPADPRGLNTAHEATHAARRDCPNPPGNLNNAQKVMDRFLKEGTAEAAAKYTAIQLAERGDGSMLNTALNGNDGYANIAQAMVQKHNSGANQSQILQAGIVSWLDTGIASSTFINTIEYMKDPRCVLPSGPVSGQYTFATEPTKKTVAQRVQSIAVSNGYNCAPGRR